MATITREALLEGLSAEEHAIDALLKRISDEQWSALRRTDGWSIGELLGHIGDSSYGLALMAERGALVEGAPTTASGQLDIETVNAARRQRHASMSREKITQRLRGGLAEARRVLEQSSDDEMTNPGPSGFGLAATKGDILLRVINHSAEHRKEIEELLQGK